MTTTTLTLDQLEGEFADTEAEGFSLTHNPKFYALVGELFPNTDERVIHAVTLTVIEGRVGDLETSQVRRVIQALENGFVNEPYFVSTFNAEYPVTEDDLGDRAEWENTALVVKRDGGDVRWGFEGSEL
ncbi:hypothetical protein KDW85_27040 [Burkholderia cenocepacia]|uniref:hypothetical protein n=1 Tax=Burkholderia cenocepacia TaxID=95486 RepID=UPI001B98A517|nr:hypothetical protein [Burkholderia cenocepacia]MBR8042061.1 hypothetical protein [Burkholderia cenocepacia]